MMTMRAFVKSVVCSGVAMGVTAAAFGALAANGGSASQQESARKPGPTLQIAQPSVLPGNATEAMTFECGKKFRVTLRLISVPNQILKGTATLVGSSAAPVSYEVPAGGNGVTQTIEIPTDETIDCSAAFPARVVRLQSGSTTRDVKIAPSSLALKRNETLPPGLTSHAVRGLTGTIVCGSGGQALVNVYQAPGGANATASLAIKYLGTQATTSLPLQAGLTKTWNVNFMEKNFDCSVPVKVEFTMSTGTPYSQYNPFVAVTYVTK
jgi:hypothetical protein